MRKIVCGCFDNIYKKIGKKTPSFREGRVQDAEILKSGKMSDKNRRIVTDECIKAVTEHLHTTMTQDNSSKAGYMWQKKDGIGNYVLTLFDDTKYKIVSISEEANKEVKND